MWYNSIRYSLLKIIIYSWVGVSFLLVVVVRYGDPPLGVGCGLHCLLLLGGVCGVVGWLPVENMCVVRMQIVCGLQCLWGLLRN
jgi:hypothetical protein